MISGSTCAASCPPGLPAPGSFTFLNRGVREQQTPADRVTTVNADGQHSLFRLLEVPKELENLFVRAAECGAGKRKRSRPEAELQADVQDVSEASTSGDYLVIRGSPADGAVVCTKSRTYSLKERQTSNSLLVCARRNGQGVSHASPHLVIDVQTALLECYQRVPRLDILDELLRRTAYDGLDREQELRASGVQFYGTNELKELVQASEDEIIDGLRARDALVIDGFHRVLTRSCTHEMLDILLTTAVSEGIHLHALSLSQCLEAVRREVGLVDDERIFKHVAKSFSKRRLGDEAKADSDKITMCQERVGKFIAEWILCEDPNKVWVLDEFMERWDDALPDTFQADAQLLKVLAIIEPADHLQRRSASIKPGGMTLRYFPRSSLSSTAPLRFQELFFARPRWPAAEIRPYLEDLEISPVKVDKLLLKYARSIKETVGIVYTSRVKGA